MAYRAAPFTSQVVVVPDDDVDLDKRVRSLEVITEGNVVCIAWDDSVAVTRLAVPAGTIIPGCIRRVMEATTATVVALR